MSVTTTANRIDYLGDGVTTVFSFPYLFLSNASIVVIVNGVTITMGFTTTGAGNDTGGNVTFSVAPTNGYIITLIREPDLLQQTVLSPNDPFPAKTVETMSDKLTLIAQRLFELVNRSFRLSDSDTSGASTTLPTPVANNLIAWNSAATGLQNVDPITFAGIVAYGTWTAVTFSGDGVTTDFTLPSDASSVANMDVSIGAAVQRAVIDYTYPLLNTIRFTSAPPVGTNNIFVRYGSALPIGVASSVVGQTTIGTQLIQAATAAAARTVIGAYSSSGGRINGDIEFAPGFVLSFEGSSEDAFETSLAVVNPSADRVATIPDKSGTLAMLDDVDASNFALSVTINTPANGVTLSLAPSRIKFRSSTIGSGTDNIRVIATSISTVISSGSTAGSRNATLCDICVLAIDNAGTVELAWTNAKSGANLDESRLITTVAEGGAGAADAENVIYSTTARSNVPFRVVGYFESTQATAGTWVTPPSKIQNNGGLAGQFGHVVYTPSTTPLTAAGIALTASHNLGNIPFVATLEFVCINAVQNYAVGDVAQVPGQWNGATVAGMTTYVKDAVTVLITLPVGQSFYLNNKTTGANFSPNVGDWAYRFALTK